MTGREPRPPRWSRSVIAWAAGRLGTPDLPSEADDLFADLAAARGPRRARAWYRRQARAALRRAVFSPRRGFEPTGPVPPRGSPVSWLDVKLGVRMLVKSPLLTVTGCVAIATAIGINAGFNEFIGDMFSGMRVPSGGRIVALTNQDLESGGRDNRVLGDLARWRDGLQTVERIGVANRLDLNLIGPDGRSTPVDAAEVSASAFELTDVVPHLGRGLQDSDDGPAAEPVVVLGYDAWQTALGGDPDAVGSTVRLGEVVHTVVGVAPPDFAFPSRQEAWVNFRQDLSAYAPRSGPSVIAFGRLVPGRTLDEARAEMGQLGDRASADHPRTHAQLRATVMPYEEMVGLRSAPEALWALRAARALFVMLLLAACANVATLVFARNAARESEIAVRNALGAGRRRILMQLFAEAMVLAVLSAGIGLFIADAALRYGSEIFFQVQRTDPPSWFDAGVSLPTVIYSLVLATVGAGIVGVLPGLRATRGGPAQTLRRAGSKVGALSFGKLPTAVIVVQVAITVALLPAVLTTAVADFTDRLVTPSFPTERYLTARLMADSEIRQVAAAEDEAAGLEASYVNIAGVSNAYRITPSLLERYEGMALDVRRRLADEPGVRHVVLTSRLPALGGQSIPATRLELNGASNPDNGYYVRTTHADPGFFGVVGRDVIDGRGFTGADYGEGERVALVNDALAQELYGGRSPVGRLVRDFRPDGDPERPWTEIVGVIPDEVAGPSADRPQIYYPLSGPGAYPLKVLVHVDGEAGDFGPRLRAIVAEAQPGMLVDEVWALSDMRRSEVIGELFGVAVLLFVALVTLLLSTTGIYSLMSFIVAQRTREIGIRTALGADAPLVVRDVFRRALVQLGLGVVLGLAVVAMALRDSVQEGMMRDLLWSGAGVAAVLVVVGLIGCAIPLARALRVQPMRALATE